MSPYLLCIVSTIYAYTGVEQFIKTDNWGWLLFWFSYAVANIAWMKGTNVI